MIRYNPPFNGRRYLWNKHTNELHDLMNEQSECKIDQISLDHIETFSTLNEAKINIIFNNKVVNGCYHCLRELDKG